MSVVALPPPKVLLRHIEDEKARRSLHSFVQLYWNEVESNPFVDNWHVQAVCEHLEAVTRGEINNLLINIPPGCAKSLLVSVMWPAWEWATTPTQKYFGASYSEALAVRDALKCRDIITSQRYAEAYGVALRKDMAGKEHYGLTSGGWRLATSVGGRGTGLHPTRKIVDDPHTVGQAESEAERETAVQWFQQTLSSRGLGIGAATVVVMQRLHQKDVSGVIMDSEAYAKNWEHLCIPMEYETRRVFKLGKLPSRDPRKEEGELLWPKLFDKSKVTTLKAALGSYGAAGQLQQRPSPAGGGILDIRNFNLWPANRDLPDFHFIVQSYDTAFTKQTHNDPTACSSWGVFYQRDDDKERACVMLLDAWSDHLAYPALRKKLLDDWKAEYGGIQGDPNHPSRRADTLLIEEKGSGQSIIQDLRIANVPVIPYNPGRADKIARAQTAAPLLESGCFYLLESKKEAGKAIRWARDFLEQLEQFPNGEHDDYADTFTQLAIYLRDAGFLTLRTIDLEGPIDVDYGSLKKAKGNPYAQ